MTYTVSYSAGGKDTVVTVTSTEVKTKKLYEDAKMPTRGSADAAGWDLYAYGYEGASGNWTLTIPPRSTVKINTGVSVSLPQGSFGGIYPRSGLATKQGLAPANKVGVVDSDYRGPLIVALYNHSDLPQIVHKGDRIAQLIVQPYWDVSFTEVEELDDTERGAGGFGSTGSN